MFSSDENARVLGHEGFVIGVDCVKVDVYFGFQSVTSDWPKSSKTISTHHVESTQARDLRIRYY